MEILLGPDDIGPDEVDNIIASVTKKAFKRALTPYKAAGRFGADSAVHGCRHRDRAIGDRVRFSMAAEQLVFFAGKD